MLQTRPVTDGIGTEISGIDLSQKLSAKAYDIILTALLGTTMILFRDQSLEPAAQVEFTRQFGQILAYYDPTENPHPEYPEVMVLTNLTKEGLPSGRDSSAYLWHHDGHYLQEPPLGSMLYAVEVPPAGGDTWFANTQAAYDMLSEGIKRRIGGLNVIISRVQSRPYNFPKKPPVTDAQRVAWPDVPQPLVRKHPISGRRALYVGSNVPWRVEGMPDDESAPLVTLLQEHSVRPELVYKHKWRPGDAIMWDNAISMHRATPFDVAHHRRIMHRTTIAGGIAA
jgi:alpha-ketoglutarate-dependent taurine dioxygenase